MTEPTMTPAAVISRPAVYYRLLLRTGRLDAGFADDVAYLLLAGLAPVGSTKVEHTSATT